MMIGGVGVMSVVATIVGTATAVRTPVTQDEETKDTKDEEDTMTHIVEKNRTAAGAITTAAVEDKDHPKIPTAARIIHKAEIPAVEEDAMTTTVVEATMAEEALVKAAAVATMENRPKDATKGTVTLVGNAKTPLTTAEAGTIAVDTIVLETLIVEDMEAAVVDMEAAMVDVDLKIAVHAAMKIEVADVDLKDEVEEAVDMEDVPMEAVEEAVDLRLPRTCPVS